MLYAPSFLVNDNYLARQVVGYAHFVRLSFQSEFTWTTCRENQGGLRRGMPNLFSKLIIATIVNKSFTVYIPVA